MDTRKVLEALAEELADQDLRYELYICGGAALNLLGVSSRETGDIDVLEPRLDDPLKDAAKRVARHFGLSEKWLNNGPARLLPDLEKNWMIRAVLVFSRPKLKVWSLSRQELLNTKLWAACDRLEDINDIISLSPSEVELETAKRWVRPLDASELWPDIVDQCVAEIRRRMGNDKA